MVSLWPFKGEDTSPASFEKALSALAVKITKSQTHLDSLRANYRRYRALFTLYAILTYLLSAIVLAFVVGWRNWTAVEYTAVAGSPVVIYLVRTIITLYYNYRIDNATVRLDEQQATRAATITKLKAATKYDSTQELLEKYGGAPPKPKKEKEIKPQPKSKGSKSQPGRVGTGPPPPTANIGKVNQTASVPTTPQPQVIEPQFPKVQFHNKNSPSPFNSPVSAPPPQLQQRPTAEFAPNAYSAARSYAQATENSAGGNWYDRVLDLLMGEDETSPKNRVALICNHCRLVNGQAPPGTKRLADLGRWRCFGCGGWNGEEDEGVKAVKEMQQRIGTEPLVKDNLESNGSVSSEESAAALTEAMPDQDGNEEEDDDSVEDIVESKQPAKRGRPKGSRKKT